MIVPQGLWEMFKRVMLVMMLAVGLWGCGDRTSAGVTSNFTTESQPVATQQLSEVATPTLITELRKELDQYQPQVKILSPQPNETLNSTTVQVQLQVNDLPLFKDEELGMGPHLHLFIDDQPYQAVYDVSQPITLENLLPGSHVIRVFASRPWHESFKNEGAYAETAFNIFTTNRKNNPDFTQPLLTYSRPQGTYGAEPIMLDFYLTNAPLHFVAKETPEDNIADWRIRVTVNGESFILDNWQPIYLKGFKKGENWLKLEFIDDQGELIENVYNNPVRVINYDPKLNDTLAKLVQNKLSLRTAKKLVTTKELPPEPKVEVITPIEEVAPEIQPEPEPPSVLEESQPEESAPEAVETPAIVTPEPEAIEPTEAPVLEEVEIPVEVTKTPESELVEEAPAAIIEEEVTEIEPEVITESAPAESLVSPETTESETTSAPEQTVDGGDGALAE